jgi:hypothetical protein
MARSYGSHLVVASHIYRTPSVCFSGGVLFILNATSIFPASSGVHNIWHITITVTAIRVFLLENMSSNFWLMILNVKIYT